MDEVLKKIQENELEILLYFDKFCRENGLKYSLSGGTLLGAIRHHGFIPWDDDVDCMMMRDDYNKLLNLWNKKANSEIYILQTKDTEPEFSQSFAKIRKNNTTFLQEGEPAGKYHNGIFIDIMPADRFPKGFFKQKLYYLNVMFYQLFNREFVPSESGKAVQLFCKLLLALTDKSSRAKLRKRNLKNLTKYNSDKTLQIISTETLSSMRRLYSSDLMDNFIDVDFEGKNLSATTKWKEVLATGYGDYMQFPPVEEQQWKHHPVEIDFEHNYGEC